MLFANGGKRVPTVLIVEDDEDLCNTLASGLRVRGFNVFTAATADEALRRAELTDTKIDVIVLDLVLPDSWGSQLAISHNAFHPETRCIYISGHAREDAVLRASTQLDGIPFLEKPFGVSELAGLIEDVLGQPGQGQRLGS